MTRPCSSLHCSFMYHHFGASGNIFHWLKNVFLRSRDYFGRFSPSFCICSSPEIIIRTNENIFAFFVFERGKQKILFFCAILILYVLSLFLYLSPKHFIRAKFFHVRNIFAKFCEKTRKNFARTIIRAKFYVLLEGDNLYLFLITTAPFLSRATKKTFSKQ